MFLQVGEALPVSDASMDAVIGTLVLCSVKDVDMTLKGTWMGILFTDLLVTVKVTLVLYMVLVLSWKCGLGFNDSRT